MANNEDKLKRLNELAEEFKTLYMELFEDIAKDFERLEKKEEILELLKNHFYSSGIDNNGYGFFTFEIDTESEDYNTIERWLKKNDR